MAGPEMGGLPVSAPGAMSTRTDLPVQGTQPPTPIPSAFYGDGVETAAIQAGAPLAAKPRPKPPVRLFAPTARPNEPITAGVDIGDGVGSAAVAFDPTIPYERPTSLTSTLAKLAPVSNSPRIDALLAVARQLGW